MLPKPPKYVRRIKSKGHTYYYFDTGKRNGQRKVLSRLPDIQDPGFWGSYAALMGHRNRTPSTAGMVVPELVALYEQSQEFAGKAPKTRDAYAMYLRRLEKLLPTAPVAKLTRVDMRRLIDNMAKTPGAANLFLGTCGALFKWAEEREYIATSPVKGIKPLAMGEHDPWPDHVLEAALASKDRSVRLLTHLLYYTALRLDDALNLRWDAIKGQRLIVRHSKNKRDLDIRLHSQLEKELAGEHRRAMTIAVNEDGSPISAQVARHRLQAFAAGMGVKVVPHGLRKNAVNAMLEMGSSLAETAAVTGQSLQMVEHYAKKRDQAALSTSAVLKWEGRKANVQNR